MPADAGVGRPVTKLDTTRGEFSHRWPELVPDAGVLRYAVGTVGSWDDAAIVAQPLKAGERTAVVQGGTDPKYLPGGRLLFARGGSVFVAPFGGLVYLAGNGGGAKKTLAWVDRQGNVQPFAAPELAYSSPRLSPDGRARGVRRQRG